MKDHEKRELVDRLAELARQFADTQQLRARISGEVLPALDAAVAAERERWAERVEEAFRDGYSSRETYNDKETSCADDQWASAKAWLLRA